MRHIMPERGGDFEVRFRGAGDPETAEAGGVILAGNSIDAWSIAGTMRTALRDGWIAEFLTSYGHQPCSVDPATIEVCEVLRAVLA